MKECYLEFDLLELLMLKIGSQLRILPIENYHNEITYLDGNRWEQLISEHMPYLHTFSFKYHQYIDVNLELTEYHASFK